MPRYIYKLCMCIILAVCLQPDSGHTYRSGTSIFYLVISDHSEWIWMKLNNDIIELNFFIQINNNFRLATSEINTFVGFFLVDSSNI